MNQNSNFNQNRSKENDEINVRFILNHLLRNKFLIGATSFFLFIIFYLYSLSIKKTWQGQFQIVINTQSVKSNDFAENSISNLFNLNNSNSLNTDVGILKSPSLLMPIFEFVSAKKKIETLKFQNWEQNLEIKLSPGTSILNISYKDNNKELILPVLNKISLAYQDYSGSKRKRELFLTEEYLKKQIKTFKDKSNDSINKAQQFAIEQDLIIGDLIPQKENIEDEKNLLESNLSNIYIENVRAKAANEIRRIDSQIIKINEMEDDYEKIQYMASTIPALVSEGLTEKLSLLDQKLVETRVKYTDLDRAVLSIIEEKDLMVKLIKKRALGFLKAQRVEEEARLEAAIRPKGVLQKYKKLLREAVNDEFTLTNLEKQLRVVELEKARLTDPWKLITMPTLYSNAVGPQKRNYAFLGLVFGFFIGLLISIYKERKSDLIFDEFVLEDLLDTKILARVDISLKEKISEENIIIEELININRENKIRFFKSKFIDTKVINKFKEIIPKNKKNIFFDNDLSKIENKDINFLLTSLSKVTYREINLLKKRIDFSDLEIMGIILLNYIDS